MTNKEIREEMMLQIEQLKTINILNRLGMHNKDEEQTKAGIKSRIGRTVSAVTGGSCVTYIQQ